MHLTLGRAIDGYYLTSVTVDLTDFTIRKYIFHLSKRYISSLTQPKQWILGLSFSINLVIM